MLAETLTFSRLISFRRLLRSKISLASFSSSITSLACSGTLSLPLMIVSFVVFLASSGTLKSLASLLIFEAISYCFSF